MRQIDRVSAREITRRVRVVSLFRFWAISILYIAAFAVAVLALGACAYSVFSGQNSQAQWKAFFALLSTSAGSGGLGGYLMSVDQRERQNIRREEALDLLLEQSARHVEDDTLHKKVIDLLAKRANAE